MMAKRPDGLVLDIACGGMLPESVLVKRLDRSLDESRS